MNWYKRQLKIAMPAPTGVNRGWSNDDLITIKKLIEEGKSMRLISRLFGVSHGAINRLNKKYKWKKNPNKQLNRIEPLTEKIKKLYLSPPHGKGLSAKDVGQQLNISPTTVRKVIKDIGEKVRNPSESFTDERREKIVERNKLRWENPENKQKMKDFWKEYWSNNENKEIRSKKMKEVNENNPQLGEESSRRKTEYWENYPGGFEEWINQFPVEKQKEILNAMNAPNHL